MLGLLLIVRNVPCVGSGIETGSFALLFNASFMNEIETYGTPWTSWNADSSHDRSESVASNGMHSLTAKGLVLLYR